MKKMLIALLIALSFCSISAAEDIYCGDFNGNPAYVELESIESSSRRTGFWVVKEYGVYPEYSKSYSANIFADGLWYKVNFVESTRSSSSATILDKNKKSTGNFVTTVKFDFAYQTVIDNYPEANRRSEEKYRKIIEERERKAIEEAKKNNK